MKVRHIITLKPNESQDLLLELRELKSSTTNEEDYPHVWRLLKTLERS
jgi:hypothetical protein